MKTVSLEMQTNKKYEYEIPKIGESVEGRQIIAEEEDLSCETDLYYKIEGEGMIKWMDPEENNNILENKIIFLCSNHPFSKKIRQQKKLLLPNKPILKKNAEESWIVGYECEKLPFWGISLKELFQRENIEKFHIESAFLCELAWNLFEILEGLAREDIYPGLLELSSIIVPRQDPLSDMRIINIERFQFLRYEQSFPWYPSDNRLFDSDLVLFDEQNQWKSNQKLIYKVLIAAEQENIKIPPRESWEYSTIFWNILPSIWKERFLHMQDEKVPAYEEWKRDLKYIIQEERHYGVADLERESTEEEQNRIEKATMIVLLREEERLIKDISRELYLLLEELEEEKYRRKLAFVYGDKYIYGHPFAFYPAGFRVQMKNKIKNYSFGEAILIATELMREELEKKPISFCFYFVVDGQIRKDSLFLHAVQRLEQLLEEKQGEVLVLPIGECSGEAYGILKNLTQKTNYSKNLQN